MKKTINRQPPGKKRRDSLEGGISYHSMFQLILYIATKRDSAKAPDCLEQVLLCEAM